MSFDYVAGSVGRRETRGAFYSGGEAVGGGWVESRVEFSGNEGAGMDIELAEETGESTEEGGGERLVFFEEEVFQVFQGGRGGQTCGFHGGEYDGETEVVSEEVQRQAVYGSSRSRDHLLVTCFFRRDRNRGMGLGKLGYWERNRGRGGWLRGEVGLLQRGSRTGLGTRATASRRMGGDAVVSMTRPCEVSM